MAPPSRTLVIPCQPSRRRLRPPPPATRGTDMLGRLIDWSVRNVFLVLVMTLAIVAGDIYALMNTPLDPQPDLSVVQVLVSTEYPCQSPQVVEYQVTYPLTSALLALPKPQDYR